MQTDPKYFIFAGIGVLILQTILIVIPITAMKRAKKLKIDDDNAVLRMFVLMYCLIYTTLLLKGMWYMNRNGGMFVTERKRKFERPLFGLFGVLIVVNMLFFFASPFVMSIVKGFYPEIPGAFLLNTTITLLATFELLTQRTEYNSSIVKLQNTNAEISSTPLTDENAKTVYELTNYYKRIKEPARYYRGQKLDDGRIKAIHASDFYQLSRWIRELELIEDKKDPKEVIQRLKNEMNVRTQIYDLDADEKRRYWQLAQFDVNRDHDLTS